MGFQVYEWFFFKGCLLYFNEYSGALHVTASPPCRSLSTDQWQLVLRDRGEFSLRDCWYVKDFVKKILLFYNIAALTPSEFGVLCHCVKAPWHKYQVHRTKGAAELEGRVFFNRGVLNVKLRLE